MKYLDRLIKSLEHLIDSLVFLAMLIAWIFGVALAPGWDVVAALFFPPYAWVLLAQALLKHWGLL
jgi:predicted membrane protein